MPKPKAKPSRVTRPSYAPAEMYAAVDDLQSNDADNQPEDNRARAGEDFHDADKCFKVAVYKFAGIKTATVTTTTKMVFEVGPFLPSGA